MAPAKTFLLCALALATTEACRCKDETTAAPATVAVSAGSSAMAAASAAPGVPRRVSETAVRHLPAGCQLVLRIDVKSVLHNPVLGEGLLAGVDAVDSLSASGQAGTGPTNRTEQALGALLRELDLEPKRDVAEVAGCLLGSSPDGLQGEGDPQRFLVVVSGDFPRNVVERVRAHAPDRDEYRLTQVAGSAAIERDGRWLTQAPDHALLLSNLRLSDDVKLIEQAFVAQDGYKEYRLPPGEVSVVVNPQALAALGSGHAAGLRGTAGAADKNPAGGAFQRARRVDLGIDLAAGKVSANLVFANEADAKTLRAAVMHVLAELAAQAKGAPAASDGSADPWSRVLEGISFNANAEQLTVAVSLPPGLIEWTLFQLVLAPLLEQEGLDPAGRAVQTP